MSSLQTELEAEHAKMNFEGDWEMRLTQIKPLSIGDYFLAPQEIIFNPKNGLISLNSLQFGERLNIDALVLDPALANVRLENITGCYSIVALDHLVWSHWDIKTMYSRDLLTYLPNLSNFLSKFPATELNETPESKGALLQKTATLQNYQFTANTIDIHYTILHFRIGLTGVTLETLKGTFKSPRARLNLDAQELTLYDGTLSHGPATIPFERVRFNLKSGALERI